MFRAGHRAYLELVLVLTAVRDPRDVTAASTRWTVSPPGKEIMLECILGCTGEVMSCLLGSQQKGDKAEG